MEKTYQGKLFKVVLKEANLEEVLNKKNKVQERYIFIKNEYRKIIGFLQPSLDPLNTMGTDEKYLSWLLEATNAYKSLIELEKINQWLTAWEHELDKEDLLDPKSWM